MKKTDFDQAAYIREYNREHYDRLHVFLARGEKEKVKEHAATTGETMNAFIKRAILETMDRDKGVF